MARAVVTGARTDRGDLPRKVRAHLPSNFDVVSSETISEDGYPQVTIEGDDRGGWTFEGYVKPRLASGMYAVKEVRDEER